MKGVVLINFLLDEKGIPTDAHVVRGLGYGLDENAIETVKSYRFRPATENGHPVLVEVNVEVHYQNY